MKKFFSGLLGLLLFMGACTHELSFQQELLLNNDSNRYINSESDLVFSEVAKALRLALVNNNDARKLVQSMALEMKDGDYDIVLGDILMKKVSVSDSNLVTKGFDRIDFSTLLNAYINASNLATKSNADSIIQNLQAKYPLMQIAVPVHADEWDVDNYVPVVCFLPSNYDEVSSRYIPGYDSDGNYVELDSFNEPEVPVIVISRNERGGDSPRLTVVEAPTNLSTSTTETSILLYWNWVNGADGYKVWRKGPSDNSFNQVGALVGSYNATFEDNSISALANYFYYVTAYSEVTDSTGFTMQYESTPSNTVLIQAPDRPTPLSSLSITMVTSSKAQLSWQDTTHSSSDVKVDFMVPGSINTFAPHGTLSNGETEYIASLPYLGKRHVFKVYKSNSLGNSDPHYDFCYNMYRNINGVSSVYVKNLSYTGVIENWAQGAPEFRLKVFYCNENAQTSVNELHLDFSGRTHSQSFNGKLAYSWTVTNYLKDWYSSLYLYLYEKDDAGISNIHVNIAPQIGVKCADSLDLNVTYGSISFDIDSYDEVLGGNSIYYFENPERVLSYGGYNGQMTISQNY